MKFLKAPKTNRMFWYFHLSGWGVLALINFLSRMALNAGSVEQELVLALMLIVVNTFLCLLLREMIHRFDWINVRRPSIWVMLVISSIFLGFISGLMMTAALGLYYLIGGYSSNFIFFWFTVYSNWLIMSVVICLWAVVYVLTNHMGVMKQIELKEQHIKLELKDAQLNTLMGQLNPHFLFNGMNNIRALMLESVTKSREMLTALSDILSYSLQSNKMPLQGLENEIDVVRSYVKLAEIQYEGRLKYIETIDENLLKYTIPPMLIQLLIENAIRHGIDRCVSEGELCLSITSLDEKIMIEVSNPGNLDSQSGLSGKTDQSTGLGLNNIRQRLELLFSDEASFKIKQCQTLVKATITIPMVESSL